MTIQEAFDQLQQLIKDVSIDVVKANEGNQAAGIRVRKTMQDVKTSAQNVRTAVILSRGK